MDEMCMNQSGWYMEKAHVVQGKKINMIKNARIWRAGIIKLFGMVHDHRSKR